MVFFFWWGVIFLYYIVFVLGFLLAEGVGDARVFGGLFLTGLCFIWGVGRFLVATGGGPHPPPNSATTVFSGMLVATVVGIVFIPALFV
ncbi:hypothetical protein, partial [Enterobacter hormaechei]